MTLYEITDTEGEILEDAVTIKEASRMVNRPIDSLYSAAAENRTINRKYRLRAVDKTISKTRDVGLLAEYDCIRQQLLRTKKRGRKMTYCTNECKNKECPKNYKNRRKGEPPLFKAYCGTKYCKGYKRP